MKRKIVSSILTLCLLAVLLPGTVLAVEPDVWDGTVAESFAGGSGTAEDPYRIENGAQLALVGKQADDGDTDGVFYVLTKDINLGGKERPWTPIGTERLAYCKFQGTFDGGGHAVTNLFVDAKSPEGYSDTTYAALFGYVDLGTIRNLAVSGTVQSIGSRDVIAGGIAGFISGNRRDSATDTESGSLISGCTFTGSITVKAEGTDSNRAYAYAGGIAGIVGSASAVLDCRNAGTILCDSSHMVYAGGIAAQNSGQVIGCRSSGSVTGISAVTDFLSGGQGYMNYVGGIVGQSNGYLHSPMVSNCLNMGAVAGEGGELFAGGIVGYSLCQRDITLKSALNYGTVVSCANLATVSGNSVKKSYDGSLTAAYVGGIAGGIRGFGRGKAIIMDCYSVGNVSCGDGAAGGVVGVYRNGVNNWMTVDRCYSTGALSGSEEATLGGVIGLVTDGEPTVSACTYLQPEDADSDPRAIGKGSWGLNEILLPLSAEAFADWGKFSDWNTDDTDVWKMGTGLEPDISPVTARPILVDPDESDKTVPVTGVTLGQKELTLVVGETATLTARVLPPDATDKSLLWGSSDEKIAVVDETGTVTAVSEGTAEIAASAGGRGAVCTVTVVPARIGEATVDGDRYTVPVLSQSDGTAFLAAYTWDGRCLTVAAQPLEAGAEARLSLDLTDYTYCLRAFIVDKDLRPVIPPADIYSAE